jgi:predicted Ser/Thr protein kinase
VKSLQGFKKMKILGNGTHAKVFLFIKENERKAAKQLPRESQNLTTEAKREIAIHL